MSRNIAAAALLLCGFVAACGTSSKKTLAADEPSPPSGNNLSVTASPEQARVEAALSAAGEPYKAREDLKLATLPPGCTWHGVYVTENPEVVLETFVFAKAVDAETYNAARTNDDAARPERKMHIAGINNGLLLITCYDDREDGDAKFEAAVPFVNAFSAGR